MRALRTTEDRDEKIVEALASDSALLSEIRTALPTLRNHAKLGGGADAVRRAIGAYLPVYPQPDRSTAEWSAWWFAYEQILSDLPEAALTAAMLAWSKKPDSRFLPAPGELMALARHIVTPAGRAYARARAAVDLSESIRERPIVDEFKLEAPALREIKTDESREWAVTEAAKFKAEAKERARIVREAATAMLPPVHGELAPGRHITPEMVALLTSQGVVLPPPAEVDSRGDLFL